MVVSLDEAIIISQQLETGMRRRMTRPRTFVTLSPPTVWPTSTSNRCVLSGCRKMNPPALGGEDHTIYFHVSFVGGSLNPCTQKYFLVPSVFRRPVLSGVAEQ